MLPYPEIDGLLNCVTSAAELARCGEFAGGYALLCDGLHYAEDLEEQGRPYAPELADRYRRAVEQFRCHYHYRVRLD